MRLVCLLSRVAAVALVAVVGGCAREKAPLVEAFSEEKPRLLRLQIDWLPQIESGGYYQAQARGYYRALGLQVEIHGGGPGVPSKENVAAGVADIGAGDGNCVLVAASRGKPLVIVGAEMQHSPVGLMFHRTRPLRSVRDLDGRTVVASGDLAWVDYLQSTQRVRFDLRPATADLAGFVVDESLVRKCFVTQEPFVAERLGAKVGALLLADSGYDPYRVIYSSRDFAEKNPEAIRRFLAATIAGYNDLLGGDPTPAFRAIAAANPGMAEETMLHSLARMRELRLVEGRAAEGERTGRIARERIARDLERMQATGLVDGALSLSAVARFDLVPIEGAYPMEGLQTP